MSLKEKTIAGVKWNTISAVLTAVLAISKTSILARLLSPTDFGLMAMVHGVILFGSPLSDLGIGNAIIQKESVNHKQLSTLYWLNISLGVFVFIIMVGISPFVANFYEEARLQELLIWVAISFVIGPLGSQFHILMQKELSFDLPFKINFIANIVSFIVTIVLALYDWGVYSLVYGNLCMVVISTTLFVFFGLRIHKPGFYFNINQVKDLIRFGSYEMGERYSLILTSSWDKILIGKFLGAELLGYYNIAFTIVGMPILYINPIVNKVAFPVFSKIQNNVNKINSYYQKANSMLMTINFPIYIGIALVANEFVLLFFGAQWLSSVPIMQILAFDVMFRSLNTGGSVLRAKGRADVNFFWGLIRSFTVLFSIVVAYFIHPSLVSIAIGIVISRYTFGLYWHYIISKVGGIDYRPIIRDAIRISIFVGIMAVAILILNHLLIIENVIFKFILDIILGAGIYAILILKFDKKNKELILALKK